MKSAKNKSIPRLSDLPDVLTPCDLVGFLRGRNGRNAIRLYQISTYSKIVARAISRESKIGSSSSRFNVLKKLSTTALSQQLPLRRMLPSGNPAGYRTRKKGPVRYGYQMSLK